MTIVKLQDCRADEWFVSYKVFLQQKSEEVRMPAVLETDDTKAWHIYKETGEVQQNFKNRGPGSIHSYMKAKQIIYAKKPPKPKQNPQTPKPVASSSVI